MAQKFYADHASIPCAELLQQFAGV
ncbi:MULTISPECIES: hypothetical protein [Enterobacter]